MSRRLQAIRARLKGRLSSTAGFTLGEVMVTVIIVGLVAVGLTQAVGLGSHQYIKSLRTSESKVLTSTLETVIGNELRNTTKFTVQTDSGEEIDFSSDDMSTEGSGTVTQFLSVTYSNVNTPTHFASLDSDGNVLDSSQYGQVALGGTADGSDYYNLILGAGSYTTGLTARVDSVTYDSSTCLFTVTVSIGVGQDEAYSSTTFNVRALNFIHGVTTSGEEANTYTVTFDANGGSGSMSSQTMSCLEAGELNTNEFTRDGYSFTGWNTAADGSGTAYAENESVLLSTYDGATVTLYAQWGQGTHTVTYYVDGSVASTQQVNNGEKATQWQPQAQTGYNFKGWYTDSACTTSFDFNTAIDNDVALYGKWVAWTFTIMFHKNGGSGSMSSIEVEYGKSYTLPKNTFTYSNGWGPWAQRYSFSGWNTSASGKGVLSYADQGTLEVNEDFVTKLNFNESGRSLILYAQWTR